ncbi:hypothetical protein WIW50_12460 [Flavobacteriaceae bacterium 3-367]
MKILKTVLTLFLFCSFFCSLGQQPLFEQDKATILSEDNQPTAYIDTIFKGKRCLKLDSKKQSIALTKAVEAKNFRVEMDIAGAVMSGLGFHVASEHNYQFIYFRPGMGGTREAIQYIPIYNGALSWVFYNYPTYEKEADIESLEWFHAAFEVQGNRLKVFVDHSPEPQMDIRLLDKEIGGPHLLLRSMFGPSYFANITYRALPEEAPSAAKLPSTSFLRAWEVSTQFPRDTTSGHLPNKLDAKVMSGAWRPVLEPDDVFVNLSRYFEKPTGVVMARTQINAERAQRKTLYFDFVGKVRVLLNGEEVFSYGKIKFERMFDGMFRTTLDLKKGSNELLFMAEGDAAFFGEGFKTMGRLQHTNWGFIARIGD